ncbi:class gamma glutathione S-transferase 2 [Phascolomyces articulosus]|uniref:Class gamma glutathione S-transferase 2 n=1 Tax=Phascolomyces articulosus TaxID=60185 RepID=A0AAD5K7R2_9FUNG|nr:class gamma glutathione S-transferase 2 [Phascolomyces articulosus]
MVNLSHVKLTYFDIGTRGFGEPIKLLLQDSGVSHEYIRVKNDDNWPKKKIALIEEDLYFGTLPYVELEGKPYGASTPLLRYLSKKLGKYQGADDEKEHLVDTSADFCLDWRRDTNKAFFNPNDASIKKNYIEKDIPKHYGRFDRVYGLNEGPYILGQEISYADFMVYHNLVNDGRTKQGLDQYPNLAKFVEALEERPNLKEYITTLPINPAYI